MVASEQSAKQAVNGFAGAPFTLACYIIEGRPSRDYAKANSFKFSQPDAWHRLMSILSEAVVAYLRAQTRAGAQVVQLFDSWVGALSPTDYEQYVRPHVARIFDALRDVPTIHFGASTAALLEQMAAAGGDLISIDAHQSLDVAWSRLPAGRGVQGNLDATRVLAGWKATEDGARDVLRRAGGRPGHIFNLGHGVLPESDPAILRRLVDFVHEATAR
jgi:uroporphyrinogen decarboxylase